MIPLLVRTSIRFTWSKEHRFDYDQAMAKIILFISVFLFSSLNFAASTTCHGAPIRVKYIYVDPGSRMGSGPVVPDIRSGKIFGYKIVSFDGQDGKLYQALGLKAGDVVTAVNSLSFEHPTSPLGLIEAAESQKPFCIKLQRNGVDLSRLLIGENAAKTMGTCLKANGTWGTWSKYEAAHHLESCRFEAIDTGKSCRDGKDCSLHLCEYNSTTRSGTCSKFGNLEGCHAWMTNGVPQPEACVD